MRKIYSLVLMAVGLLISTNVGAQETPTWPAQFADDETAVANGAVAKIDNKYYATLQSAFTAAPASTETTVTLLTDIKPEIESGNYSEVKSNQNIIFELNGHKIDLAIKICANSAVILNSGTLTIQDNSDTLSNFVNPFTKVTNRQYRGDGSGKISSHADSPDMQSVPSVATNTITNNGTLTIKSGTIDNQSVGTASYAIDNYGTNAKTEISGGKVTSNQSNSIRMYIHGHKNNTVEITGGIVDRIWVQDGTATDSGTLTIKNTSMIGGAKIGHEELSEHFSVSITNCDVQGTIIYAFDPLAEGNSITVDKLAAKMFVMPRAKKILSNGIFNFNGDEINMGWVIHDGDYYDEYYSMSKGYRWETPESSDWQKAYLGPEANLHMFYDYIVDGYGLVPRYDLNVNEGDNWFEVAKAQNTTGEESDIYGELGNPWHQDKTWDLEAANIVPVNTTPVLIDHNVYVEEGSDAVAASVQIEAEQTLTVKNGATLQILDAGALFKDATAKLVIEPKAVVTVGSNGIIADDVKNIVIQSDANGTGVLLMNPGVTINTRPLATVKMFTKAGKRNNKWWWQHFGIPTSDAPAVSNDRDANTYVQQWVNSDWEELSAWSQMNTPFLGYNLTNSYGGTDGVTYSFKGNLVGNNDAQLKFVQNGYNLMANSYTGPLDLKTMFEKLSEELGDDVEITAWVYEAQEGQYWWANKGEIETENAGKYTIAPMQGFILRLINGTSAQGEVDYTKSIWENPYKVGIPLMSPARQGASDVSKARVVVSANGKSDLVKFYQKDEYSGDFENGYDASKYMNEHFNLFVESGNENLATVASNDMNGLYLTLQADENVEYTLSFENVNDFDYSILDIQTGITTPMVEGATYDFVASPNTTISNRFQIVSARTTPTTLDNVKAAASRNGVYTVLGQFVGKKADFNKLPAGVYVVDGQRIVK